MRHFTDGFYTSNAPQPAKQADNVAGRRLPLFTKPFQTGVVKHGDVGEYGFLYPRIPCAPCSGLLEVIARLAHA